MAAPAPSLEAYMFHLLEGRRQECRRIFDAFRARTGEATRLFTDLIWPAMESVARLYKEDRINTAVEHMATRINRQLADQVHQYMPKPMPIGKRMILLCGDGEPEELGAQMTADLFEADGWEVFYVGGGAPHDEVIALLGQLRPHILMIFGTTPQGVPGARRLIDRIREIGACPTMNILASGGVFNRAHGLWEEINADLFAPTAAEALTIAAEAPPRTARPCNADGPKKRRRRRRSPYMPAATA